MKKTLFSHLFAYILGGSILIIALFSFMVVQITGARFDDFLSERFIAERETVIDSIEATYLGEGNWDEDALRAVIQSAMHAHIIVRVEDLEGNEVASQSTSMRGHMRRMRMTDVIFEEEWLEEDIALTADGDSIGNAYVSYPGMMNLTTEEEGFLSDLMLMIFLMGLLSIVIAGILAYLVSRRLSRPIARASQTTRQIAQGEKLKATEWGETISELSELQESVDSLATQLAEQKVIRNQLVSDLSHEIRTPLATLQGNIEAMLDGVLEVTPDRLESMNRQVKRLADLMQLIDQLEDAETIRHQLKIEELDISQLLSSVVTSFEVQASEKQVRLKLDSESVYLQADRNKLEQVVSNLLSNAVKFTSSGGDIRISARRKNNQLEIIVADTGQGIPEEELGFIFERFYQVEPSRNSRLQGQGIGLAVVKSIVEAHKGNVQVSSQEGAGTQFVVSLPLKQS